MGGAAGKSEADDAYLDVDGTGALLAPCFSKVLWDLPAPPVPEEMSFASMILSEEVEVLDTVDLAGDWDFSGASSLWLETELFFKAFPKSFKTFPFLDETLKVEGKKALSGDRNTGGEGSLYLI